MLINLSTVGDASVLINEQEACGDPKKDGKTYTPVGNFSGGYNKLYYPIQIVIDLKVEHAVSDIFVFDTHDKDSLRIFTGNPKKWKKEGVIYLGGYNGWKSISSLAMTRFIMLEFPSKKTNIAEVILYGKALKKAPPSTHPITPSLPYMENLIGANALHNQPREKLKCVGSIREYHNWQWDEGKDTTTYPAYPNNQFAWAPSWVSGENWGWDFDATYKAFKNDGFELSPCLQKNVAYMLKGSINNEQKPISEYDDAQNPQSYQEHAQYLYQFVARYGANSVPASNLLLKPNQAPKSGLGYIKYVESWNEPDKWWKGRKGHFTPFELAAMCSAGYDGHEGSLGSGHGAKVADPNIKFVMGGLANLSLEYIKAMKLWSDFNRTTGFPSDVINVHHYSNTTGGPNAVLKKALSPEDDSLKYKLKELVEYRNQYLPGKEVWISEFGYDTNPNSPQGVKAIGSNDIFEVQAQWLVRSYLEIAAAGVDKAHMYFFADVNAQHPGKFNSCGLVSEKDNNYVPKTSWYYIYALKKILTGYQFDSEIPSGNPDVNIYKFTNPATATSIYAAWCNTSVDKKLDKFSFQIDCSEASLLELAPKSTIPSEKPIIIQGQKVTTRICELPVFIKSH